ncbi:MAG: AAA family ATPase [Candidatus Helarchaeota archaeon]
MAKIFESIGQIVKDLKEKTNYIGDEAIATAILLADKLGKPLLVEGMPGVGKTELAKVIARLTNRKLIRLQCYEGIDESHILYEWAYAKQLLYVEILRNKINSFLTKSQSLAEAVKFLQKQKTAFFGVEFLEPRPLLQALMAEEPIVLLIDEIDRSDRETEAFLLEFLSDFQVSVPEIGTITAKTRPFVILTSNNTRDLSDALKRRCIYLFIDTPSFKHELAILKLKVPSLQDQLARQVVQFVQTFRQERWQKSPSIAESIDWAMALVTLNVEVLDPEIVMDTITLLVKNKADLKKSKKVVKDLFKKESQIDSKMPTTELDVPDGIQFY